MHDEHLPLSHIIGYAVAQFVVIAFPKIFSRASRTAGSRLQCHPTSPSQKEGQ
ncbi:hypothetical protein M406DRAFT_321111 [Cryphonectria parasitica EP155]|uniref:Uncharacterized protein n=1 Tax=Cryphonectria parasitica (strain ATCC 38755 / EP155) TaxID=660469 RepID=A0A9P4Y925_CRYP1|nr:uncharacterized protein M406DRAFT_321111 [Cryphonectria parasitica EP155]KAF3769006.1 hypothetical protein M406DRAFT_321111 [Cryphonectria parasitica EP155]